MSVDSTASMRSMRPTKGFLALSRSNAVFPMRTMALSRSSSWAGCEGPTDPLAKLPSRVMLFPKGSNVQSQDETKGGSSSVDVPACLHSGYSGIQTSASPPGRFVSFLVVGGRPKVDATFRR